MAGGVAYLWNEWAVQILVLFSFSLQAFLYIFAGIRRRSNSAVPRVLLWLAYLLADSTATYTIGHLSISSSSRVHQLVAFWAPFLLLHLGGQDTITAYSLEDNQLWLRHLQTLVVQVMGAGYVLYRYISSSGTLVPAAILMFIVGVAKYGERIWALKCACNAGMHHFHDKLQKSYGVLPRADVLHEFKEFDTGEVVLHGAHTLLELSVNQFLDLREGAWPYHRGAIAFFVRNKDIYKVIDMELSLVYDIIYTKARVIHTYYGFFIRVVSLIAILSAFLLFQLVSKDGRNIVDVAITYILFVGAILLEMASGLAAICSTWTRHFLYTRKWDRFHRVVVSLRRLVKAESRRSWSGTLGQFNMVDYCSGRISVSSNLSKAKIVLPSPKQISAQLKELLLNEMLSIAEKHGHAEERMNSLNLNQELNVVEADFDTRIIMWHIATDVILCSTNEQSRDDNRVEAIKTLSDYMMFLLAERPEMLPGPNRRPAFFGALVWLNSVIEYLGLSRAEIVQKLLKESYEEDSHHPTYKKSQSPCKRGTQLARYLMEKGWDTQHLLEVIFGVWVEMLRYAASHCSRDSHARQLSRGGEFSTVIWLLTRHLAEHDEN